MKIIKIIFAAAGGSIIIFLVLFYAFFGNFNFISILYKNQIVYSQQDLSNDNVTEGLYIQNGVYVAKSDDAWVLIEFMRPLNIKNINIKLADIEVNNKSQIYYTLGDEFSGNIYEEIRLRKGENVITFDSSQLIKRLRFDITSEIYENFQIEQIAIVMSSIDKFVFLAVAPIMILLYCVAIIIIGNKSKIRNKIEQNRRWKKRYDDWEQIFSLAINDFKSRFSGSYLGIFWGIFQPMSTILLFWFVFQIGLRSQPIENVPFILWLSAGMIPWNFFYDGWINGTAAFTSYSYIVKKVVFKIEVLPIVKVISASILNVVFNVILLLIYCIYGRFPSVHILDMIYFSICLFVLMLGLSYITATLNVFMKDIGQLLSIVLQFLMWMTPMMWQYTMIPDKFSWFYKLNPLHYVLNGYRESLINGKWFFVEYKQMLWFWLFSLISVFIGKKLMKKLKPHFADVL